MKGIRAWAKPFVVYGSNAIAVYVWADLMAYISVGIRWDNPLGGKQLILKYFIYDHCYKSGFRVCSILAGFPRTSAFEFPPPSSV